MGNNEPITSVTTSNGTYTVGMTRTEAEQNGSYKAKIGIDFKDLDTNGDGVLDKREILVGAKNQAKRDMNTYGAMAACGAVITGISAGGSVFSAGTTLALTGVSAAATGGFLVELKNAGELYQEADRQLKELDEKW